MSAMMRFGVTGLMLLTAIALGLIAFNAMRPAKIAEITPELPAPLHTMFIVAAHALPAGTLAREEDFSSQAITDGNFPSGAILDSPEARASLRGSLIRHYIDVGSAITPADVLRPRDRGFIASVLGKDMRAVAIGVDPISGVAGLIWPGDHVDVLLTQEMPDAPVMRKVISETVLTNVRVIAIDQEMVQGTPSSNATAGKLAHTVTVEVDAENAQKIAVASRMGRLSLSIRAATADAQITNSMPTYGADVSQGLNNPEKPTGTAVTVFEGDKSKVVNFP